MKEAKTHGVYRLEGKAHRVGLFHCNDCAGQFTVTTGSVMESSHVPLNKWVLAFRLMASSKKGISAHQLHRMLGLSYKAAWFMAHRIRYAMAPTHFDKLRGIVEVDETYFGGKRRGRIVLDAKARPIAPDPSRDPREVAVDGHLAEADHAVEEERPRGARRMSEDAPLAQDVAAAEPHQEVLAGGPRPERPRVLVEPAGGGRERAACAVAAQAQRQVASRSNAAAAPEGPIGSATPLSRRVISSPFR